MYVIREGEDWYKWVVLGITFLLMITFAISLQLLPPIFDYIQEDISFTNTQAGLLMGAYAIPGIVLPFVIAILANKINKKSMILLALGVLILGMIGFSLAGNFVGLLTFRLVAGIGATFLVVLAPLLVTIFFDETNMGTAMGIFNAAVPTGTVIASNLFGVLGEKFLWRNIIQGVALFATLILVVCFFLLRLPKEEDPIGSQDDGVSRGLLSNVGVWSLAIIWSLANAQLLSYVTFGPQFFQNQGMTVQKAGLLTSMIMFLPIFLSPIIGIIVDKTGWKNRLILMGSILMSLSFLFIRGAGTTTLIWAVGLGLGFSPIPVLVFALLPEMVEENQVGMGLGVLTSSSNLGIALGPSVFGLLLDGTGGNFFIGYLTLALVSLIIVFSLQGLRKKA